jgi:hypothetical protein
MTRNLDEPGKNPPSFGKETELLVDGTVSAGFKRFIGILIGDIVREDQQRLQPNGETQCQEQKEIN